MLENGKKRVTDDEWMGLTIKHADGFFFSFGLIIVERGSL